MRLHADLILLLLYAKGVSDKHSEPITGITRLTKLLFLLEQETDVKNGFKFVAYKMGPYSPEINPAIEFLTTFPSPDDPLVDKRNNERPVRIDAEEARYLDEIVSDNDSPYYFAEQSNQIFSLTTKGEKVAKVVWDDQTPETRGSVEMIKKQYGSLSLRQLLKYVYKEYESMTSNSEIKEWVNRND